LVWSSTPYAKRYRVYRDRYYQATVTDTTWSAEAPTDKVSYYFIEADNDCDRTVSLDTCGLAGPTDVAVHDWTVLPTEFTLGQNYPNPFNPETRIEFGLPRSAHVKLEILNLLGQRVRVLVDASRSAGWHSVWWDGRDETGRVASSGVYFYRMQADEFNVTRKMILLR